ncbi:two-component sensor histidine kinase [Anaeromicropila herbilytica]|uniref:histidine kinase n=2 Tax=Anaeromicropila herbilytica TaxID=2785025 RepID=A0A7R7IBU1_9FIRM|nr:two-component sensor histidine kinase [Anaeromicropila herbilytica]
MHMRLSAKLTLCFFIIMAAMFTLLNTYGVHKMKHNLLEDKKLLLYKEASLLSKEYVTAFYNNEKPLFTLSSQLKTIDTFLDARIWVVNYDGEIITDTRDSSTNLNINDYDRTFLDYTFLENTVIPDIFCTPTLCVIKSVNANYETKGYIVISTPIKSIEKDSVHYIDIANISLLFFSVLLAGIFFVIHLITVRPMKKIIEAARQYSGANYEYPLVIKSKDEYKDLADAVTFMAGELNSLDDYQKKFVANISHDFRSPLTSIKGFTEAMLDGTIPVEMQEKYLNIILFETERLSKLTSSLLALNSFDHNGTILDITTFDINHIIKKTAESFETVCLDKKITISLVFSNKETYVQADMGKIQQVLYNLIDNAIKFSHSNSTIKVSTDEKNEKVFVSVKDYGIGIPKESLKKIWERFYKTDASRGKDKKGTGLGLSITKEILTAHNENINVISTEGVGTEFTFTLMQGHKSN